MNHFDRLVSLAAATDLSVVAVVAVDRFILECGPVGREQIESTLSLSRGHCSKVLKLLFSNGLLIKERAGSRAPTIYTHANAGVVPTESVVVAVTPPAAANETVEADSMLVKATNLVAAIFSELDGAVDPNGVRIDTVAAAHLTRAETVGSFSDDPQLVEMMEKIIIEHLASVMFAGDYSGSWTKYTRMWAGFGPSPFNACCKAIAEVAAGAGPSNASAWPSYLGTATRRHASAMGVSQ